MDMYRLLQIILSGLTLLGILLGGWKVIGIAERGVEDHRGRIGQLEANMANLHLNLLQLGSLSTEVRDMHSEIERMRNRLDRFLDAQADRDRNKSGES